MRTLVRRTDTRWRKSSVYIVEGDIQYRVLHTPAGPKLVKQTPSSTTGHINQTIEEGFVRKSGYLQYDLLSQEEAAVILFSLHL